MNSRRLLILAALLLVGPPFVFACSGLLLLFTALVDPWGPLLVFLVLCLPFGTILIGLIIRFGGRHEQDGFQPSGRWRFNDGQQPDNG